MFIKYYYLKKIKMSDVYMYDPFKYPKINIFIVDALRIIRHYNY